MGTQTQRPSVRCRLRAGRQLREVGFGSDRKSARGCGGLQQLCYRTPSLGSGGHAEHQLSGEWQNLDANPTYMTKVNRNPVHVKDADEANCG